MTDFDRQHLSDYVDHYTGMNYDIYVLGSGPSLTHIDPDFFEGKVVVATNRVADRLGLYGKAFVYTHSHYHEDTLELSRKYPDAMFFAPFGDQGFAEPSALTPLLGPNVVLYPNRTTTFDFDVDRAWPDDPSESLLVGSTSMHGAMHLACLLGAANIILVGGDCGLLDGQANMAGYTSGNLDTDVQHQIAWLARWERHLRMVANKLRAVYGVRIHSLNPWVNLQLEGHVFQGFIEG